MIQKFIQAPFHLADYIDESAATLSPEGSRSRATVSTSEQDKALPGDAARIHAASCHTPCAVRACPT